MYVDPHVLYGIGLLAFGTLVAIIAILLAIYQMAARLRVLERDADNVAGYLSGDHHGVWPRPLPPAFITDSHSLDHHGDVEKRSLSDPAPASLNSMYWT